MENLHVIIFKALFLIAALALLKKHWHKKMVRAYFAYFVIMANFSTAFLYFALYHWDLMELSLAISRSFLHMLVGIIIFTYRIKNKDN